MEAGVGVGRDGIPEGTAEFETSDVAMGVKFTDVFGNRVFSYRVTVGKFSYIWESRVVPDNLQLPLILGVSPGDLFTVLQ